MRKLAVTLLLLISLSWCDANANNAIKVRFVNGIANADQVAAENLESLTMVYNGQRSSEMPKTTDLSWRYYYNPEGGCLGDTCISDIAETAVQGVIRGLAKDFANLEIAYRSAKAIVHGISLKPAAKQLILDSSTNSWQARLAEFYAFAFEGEEESVRVASTTKKILDQLRADLSDGSGVILVAHSQGNLYAQSIWSRLSESEKMRVRIVGVGNVADSTPNNRYVTLNEDLVVAAYGVLTNRINSMLGVSRASPMAKNISGYYAGPEGLASYWSALTSPLCAARSIKCKEYLGHGFSTIYLNAQVLVSESNPITVGKHIVSLVGDSIAELSKVSLNGFSDDFSGTSLDSTKWTGHASIPSTGYGLPTVANGVAHFANCQYADTKDKVSFSGSKFVIEARFAGQKEWGRDTWIALFDPSTGSRLMIHDTNYYGWGVTVYLDKNYAMELNQFFGGTTSAYKEYRIAVEGTSVTVERGDSLATLSEKHVVTLPRSATDGKYYLGIGTGGCDGFYSPGDFDWIRVTAN